MRMVALVDTLLTDVEDVNDASMIKLMWEGCERYLCGDIVRSFIRATKDAYLTFPEEDCLAKALGLVPPEMRPVFEYLYGEREEVIK